MRTPTTVTIEDALLARVRRTRGKASVSQRVNQLLQRGLLAERYDRLREEAKVFFASADAEERRENRAFQRAALRTLRRD